MNDTNFGCGTLVFGGIALVILLVILFSIFGFHVNTGNGQHVGYVTSTETNGIFFKTHRAYIKTDTQSSQEDSYCVIDPAVFAQLGTFADQKAHVEVKYYSLMSAGISKCGGESAIISAVTLAPIAQ